MSQSRLSLSFVSVVFGLALGCAESKTPAPAPPTAAPTSAPPASTANAEGSALPSPSSIDSLLGEDAFKALHELKADAAPAPHGVNIDLDGTKAYLSLPKGEGPFPGVIVIHEWWGLNDHIRHWADRLAEDGYAALAVDLYGGHVATTRDEAMTFMKTVDDARAEGLLKNAQTFLASDPRVRAPKTASIGWCFGGGWSLRTALTVPELDAAVIYYGRLVDDPEELAKIKAPLLGVFGNLDTGIPPEAVDAFDKALTTAGVLHKVHRFDANHAFANPSSERYDHAAAGRAWELVRAFLAEQLKG